jgi:hypothetical protein
MIHMMLGGGGASAADILAYRTTSGNIEGYTSGAQSLGTVLTLNDAGYTDTVRSIKWLPTGDFVVLGQNSVWYYSDFELIWRYQISSAYSGGTGLALAVYTDAIYVVIKMPNTYENYAWAPTNIFKLDLLGSFQWITDYFSNAYYNGGYISHADLTYNGQLVVATSTAGFDTRPLVYRVDSATGGIAKEDTVSGAYTALVTTPVIYNGSVVAPRAIVARNNNQLVYVNPASGSSTISLGVNLPSVCRGIAANTVGDMVFCACEDGNLRGFNNGLSSVTQAWDVNTGADDLLGIATNLNDDLFIATAGGKLLKYSDTGAYVSEGQSTVHSVLSGVAIKPGLTGPGFRL